MAAAGVAELSRQCLWPQERAARTRHPRPLGAGRGAHGRPVRPLSPWRPPWPAAGIADRWQGRPGASGGSPRVVRIGTFGENKFPCWKDEDWPGVTRRNGVLLGGELRANRKWRRW